MGEIWTMGEILVEIMRPRVNMQLYERGEFIGPFPSGAPANFIDAVARLGHKAGIIGGVGDDDFGRCVLERLKKDGVNVDYVLKVPGKTTAVAFVTYFDDGSRKFIFHMDGTPAVMARAQEIKTSGKPDFFHIMGCSLMANSEFCNAIIETMKQFVQKGAKVSFDPNIRPELLGSRDLNQIIGPVMENCSVLFPGVEEILLISGEKNIDDAVEKLFQNPVLEVIALKKGSKGSTVFARNGRFDLGVYEIVPRDPTGAGDFFDAGFLCGMAESKPLAECAKIASAAAALNTAVFGPMEGDLSPDSIREMMSRGIGTGK